MHKTDESAAEVLAKAVLSGRFAIFVCYQEHKGPGGITCYWTRRDPPVSGAQLIEELKRHLLNRSREDEEDIIDAAQSAIASVGSQPHAVDS